MKEKLAKYKPAASIRTHLLVAAAIWSLVGTMLLLRGLLGLAGPERYLVGVAGLVAGTFKSLLVLDRAARRNVRRILACKEGLCLGGVYSVRMWGLVLVMIIGGRLLRAYAPAAIAWLVYLAIGWALLLSSRLIWQQWKKQFLIFEG